MHVQQSAPLLPQRAVAVQREKFYDGDTDSLNSLAWCNVCLFPPMYHVVFLYSQDEVVQLYERLQEAGMSNVIQQFEKVIGGFCAEIREQRDLNERLHKKHEQWA